MTDVIEIIKMLSRDMAMNMVDTSTVGETENRDCIKTLLSDEIYKERYELKDNPKFGKRIRNILVIGAGASIDVNGSCFKTWPGIAKAIVEDLNNENSIDISIRKVVEQAVEEIKMKGGFENCPPEVYMEACSKMKDERYVRRKVKTLVGYKDMPSLFYQVAAHMFKHRALDVIINFNFDETLDNILDDEMGNSDYFKIFMNGHCPEKEELFIDHKLRIPLYIKPHGTMRHLGSLRLTSQSYYDGLNSRISELIEMLLSSSYQPEGQYIKTILPVNIIAAGYSFSDFDFARIIKTAYEKNSGESKLQREKRFSFFVFDHAKDQSKYIKASKRWKEIQSAVKAELHYIPCVLGQGFKQLWNGVESHFRAVDSKTGAITETVSDGKKMFPRNIARHELIAEIFNPPGENKTSYRYVSPREINEELSAIKKQALIDENDDYMKYLERRILLELALLIGKSDGVLHISQIQESRVGKYCNIYLDKYENVNKNYSCLEAFIKRFSCLKPLMGNLADTFVVSESYMDKGKVNASKLFARYHYDLMLTPDQLRTCPQLFENACALKLCTVNPSFNNYHVSVFNHIHKANLLYSDMRWFYKFRSLFDETYDWNMILCCAETG